MSRIKHQVLQDIKGRKSASTTLQIVFMYFFNIGVRTTIRYRYLQYLNSRGGGYFYKLLLWFYMRNISKMGCYLRPETQIGDGVVFPHNFPLVIHEKTVIGKNCIIHPNVQIGTSRTKSGAPIIGDNCFLGNGCHIIGNCKIGNYCFISPGAFVSKDIPDGSVVGFGINNILSSKGENVVKMYMQ